MKAQVRKVWKVTKAEINWGKIRFKLRLNSQMAM